MRDITSVPWLKAKAILFVVLGAGAAGVLLVEHPSTRVALLLALCIWAFCRAYYFAFHVITGYIDPAYRFSGLGSAIRFLARHRASLPPRQNGNPPSTRLDVSHSMALDELPMKHSVPVSGYQKTERLVYFARMCSKARLMRLKQLPAPYHPFLGTGFDGRCCRFLKVKYEDVLLRINEGLDDEGILQWCYRNGRRPNDEEVFIWNLFMEKRGWRDDDSELVQREKESIGMGKRDEIQTLFDLYDFDEGRRS